MFFEKLKKGSLNLLNFPRIHNTKIKFIVYITIFSSSKIMLFELLLNFKYIAPNKGSLFILSFI